MKRILIVEDNPVSRRILENSVAEKDTTIEVVAVESGSEAIFYYFTQTFDLIFLDILMPKINGYHFLTIIEDNIQAGNIKTKSNIVVQTAIQSFAELKAISKKEIVRDVLRKPITVKQVHECMAMYC